MDKIHYPTVMMVLGLEEPTENDEEDRITKPIKKPLDELEPGLRIFDQDLNPSDSQGDLSMRGMGKQLNRMG